jgi:hypothetical protein
VSLVSGKGPPSRIDARTIAALSRFVGQAAIFAPSVESVRSIAYDSRVSSALGIEHATRLANRSAAIDRLSGSDKRISIAAHPAATAALGELFFRCDNNSMAASTLLLPLPLEKI